MIEVALAERGFIPDFLIRMGIRARLQNTLDEVTEPTEALAQIRKQKWIAELRQSPIALVPEKANEQHYELPPEFFKMALGGHLKYSSGYWPEKETTLDGSESEMLQLSCERAELADGQDILELGCGWGSLSLWMASHYPNSNILAVSNSNDQRKFIMGKALKLGLKNLRVETADMNDFGTEQIYDRVISIEMFEHMRNYESLMERITVWLKPGGKLFVHIFTHDQIAYPFLDRGPEDWMTRFFFTGGQMPSHDLLPQFATSHLKHSESWKVNGRNYAKTSRAWLKKTDQSRPAIINLFKLTYGADQARVWFHRWRLFFMACEELFNFKGGDEWYVSHYLFTKLDSHMEGT
ncbi:MAG: class I SAM-dependent methyltransferase [Candidatus Marinimicrobia bacterium]|nr:class I SAM-dependent methyltransferase [Candidatus Neomarinimicrobiota bacterium]